MIHNINLSSYYRMARMNHSLNSFISQARITKAQLSNTFSSNLSFDPGIGRHVDIMA